MADLEDIERQIREKISVDRSQVLIAKNFILNWVRSGANPTTRGMMLEASNEFLASNSAQQPSNFIINPVVPLEPQIEAVATSISWKFAFSEGVWDLVHKGTLLEKGTDTFAISARQNYTLTVPYARDINSTWRFSDLEPYCPRHVIFAPSRVNNPDALLADGDLYLQYLSIPSLHIEVADFLRQSILCFRHELYLPAVAMLGSASETVWVKIGELLVAYVDSLAIPPTINGTVRSRLTEPLQGIALKIAAILDLYQQHQSVALASIVSTSGIKIDSLRAASSWANNVRTARNALHPAGGTGIPATYETVSMFLLATSQHLGTLYSLHDALSSTVSP